MLSTLTDSNSLISGRRSVAGFANEACNLYAWESNQKGYIPMLLWGCKG